MISKPMSKKKKAAAPAPVPEVPAAELARAKEFLTNLRADITYSAAKSRLKKSLGMTGEMANAAIVRLHEEGWGRCAQRNVFENPEAKSTTGIVKGARRVDGMSIVPQGDEGEEIAIPWGARLIPGDVVEIRCTVNGWRVGRFISRPQRRWVCKLVSVRRKGDPLALFKPVSNYAPIELFVTEPLPANVDATRDAVELEILEEETPAEGFGSSDGYNYGEPETPELHARFIRVVGALNDPLGEMAIASAQFGVPIDFSPETLEEAAKLPDKVDRRSLQNRVDLTDLPFVTIDGEDARDFDDAVCCVENPGGGWRLLVAIADVSRYVRPGTSLDRDAQIRATSVYFPSTVVPMLPEKLSNGLCSLNPGVDRLVMVCDAIIDRKGRTSAYQFYPAVIHSHARLTYTIVWSALQGEPQGVAAVGPRLADLERLYALFKVLRTRRAERGALDFETQESAADFNAKGEITGFHVREHNDAHRLIEEAMLVANVCAAEFVLKHKQLTLFRVHDKPDPKKLAELSAVLAGLGIPWSQKVRGEDGRAEAESIAAKLARIIAETKDKPYVQTAILRTMQRACYQPENIGHFGLQYEAYAHFTSPIRRYPDLLLHRTIKGILARRAYVPKVAFDDAEVMTGYHARKLGARPEEAPDAAAKKGPDARRGVWTRLGIICSAAERRADDATRDVMKFLKCDFLRTSVGKTFEGVITGFCAAGAFIELEQMPVDGFVHVSRLGWGYYEYDEKTQQMVSYDEMKKYCIGDRVRVRLESVELEERRINFEMISNYARHRMDRGSGRSGGRGRGRQPYWRGDDWRIEGDDDDDFI